MMNIPPLRHPAASGDPAARGATAAGHRRGRVLTDGLLLAAIIAAAALAGPAALASPSPSPSPYGSTSAAPHSSKSSAPASSKQLAPKGLVKWSLEPASATAPDQGRLKFSYANVQPGSTITDHGAQEPGLGGGAHGACIVAVYAKAPLVGLMV